MTRTSCNLLALGAALAIGALPALAAKPQRIDLATPEGANQAARKVQCSLIDGEPTVYYFHGEAFSRVRGEPDRHLFNVEGMNIRTCASKTEGKRGTGWRLVSREVLFYVDHKTGQLLRKWYNPWLNREVDVLQTANDPVNQRFQFPRDENGNPSPSATWDATVQGDHWWRTLTVPLFYRNPLQGDYQRYVGGVYHATEMFNFFGNMDDLTDPKKPNAAIKVGWVRMATWLPWMEMGDREGMVYIHAAGRKLDSWEQLPAVIKDEIAATYPEYRKPPALDDTRPNETSWTYFKKKVPNPVPLGR